MAESAIAKKAKELIKSADDLINDVKKDTAKIIKSAKDLKDSIRRDK